MNWFTVGQGCIGGLVLVMAMSVILIFVSAWQAKKDGEKK
jgi:Na+/H+ antiporter NhaC